MRKKDKKGIGYSMTQYIPILISFVALIVSVISAIYQSSYMSAEYEYKIDAKTVESSLYKIDVIGNKKYIKFDNFSIKIIEKNNLSKAYLINPNGIIKQLEIEDDYLKFNGNEVISLEEKIEKDDNVYRYRFLLLKSLNGDYDLYLILSYEKDGLTNFYKYDEVEIENLRLWNDEILNNLYNEYQTLNQKYKAM